MEKIKIKLLSDSAIIPTYGSKGAAGADIYANIESELTILPHSTIKIPSGLSIAIPDGYAGLICARSGLATKQGLAPANKVGIIDSDYRGEIIVALHNHSDAEIYVSPGQRIAQLLIVPVFTPGFITVDNLNDTERGDAGFGSTGMS